jgi:hypothetical protein
MFFDAGTVTVRETELERTSYFAPLLSPVFPGDLVEMAATGSADVPAHSGSVRLPPFVTIIEPTVDENLAIDRSTKFELTWTPVDDGDVAVSVGTPDVRVNCSVPAGRGRLVIPVDVLQRLPATDPATPAGFGITQTNHTVLRPKGWEVGLYASGPVVSAPVALR